MATGPKKTPGDGRRATITYSTKKFRLKKNLDESNKNDIANFDPIPDMAFPHPCLKVLAGFAKICIAQSSERLHEILILRKYNLVPNQ